MYEWRMWSIIMIINLLFLTCKQLISSSFKNFCISPFKKKHFPWKLKCWRHIKDASNRFFRWKCFIRSDSHHILFFFTFESIRIFQSLQCNGSPFSTLTPKISWVILLTVSQMILITFVWRIWYHYPIINIFLTLITCLDDIL